MEKNTHNLKKTHFEIIEIWRALWFFGVDSVVNQSTARLNNGAAFQ